jgi:hypothetical protein
MAKMGRPSDYSDALADTICEKLMSGESLRAIARLPTMPDASTLFRWLELHEYFRNQYARARTVQADLKFDELQEIADDGTNDWMTANDPDNPGYKANGEHQQRSRLRVDTLKWRLSKMLPKKYGDKIETTLRTEPGEPVEISASLDPIEAAKLYHKIMGT